MIPNNSRIIDFINGITGVGAGSQAVVNMPVNRRYHRVLFQCKAVNYTGGTALTTTKLTGSGDNALTVTPTVTNGVITSVAVVAGGSAYVTGDTITINDVTGSGFVGTVTAAGGVVSAVAVTSVGNATPVSPTTFFSSIKLLVNGVTMRDISPTSILKIITANPKESPGVALGELPIYFTPPWRNVNQSNDITSWDLFGQATFSIQLGISNLVTNPNLVGIQEYDYQRNTILQNGKSVPFLQPTAQHEFTFNIGSGRTDINTLPYNFPISRLWISGSVPGSISQVELYLDGNKAFEGTIEQLKQSYQDMGFWFGQPNYLSLNRSSVPALAAAYENPVKFDAAVLSDPDQRWGKAFRAANSLVLRVYSDAAQVLNVVQETLPGAYA